MARVLQLRAPAPVSELVPAVAASRRLTPKQDAERNRRLLLAQEAAARYEMIGSIRGASEWLAVQLTAGRMPPVLQDAAAALARSGCAPSAQTIGRDLKRLLNGGAAALASNHKGRVRKAQPWETQATEYFQLPSWPSSGQVAWWLQTRHGFTDVTSKQVHAFRKTLPSNLAETSPQAMGRHRYNQTVKPFRMIEKGSIPPGVEWEIDGHRCDYYVAHPVTGKHYRPELTVIVDKGSGYFLAWTFCDNERAINTLYAVSLAIRRHNHIPLFLHADPGSTKAKMMSDELTGFLQRVGIQVRFAHPGNARGKGLIEGAFHHYEDRCGALFNTFCGGARTDDELSRLESKIDAGKIPLPAQRVAEEETDRYFRATNARIARGWPAPRAELWAQRAPRPLAHPEDAVARPADTRTVDHWRIRHGNRFYQAPELAQFERRKVLFEYEMDDDSTIWVFTLAGEFICTAKLVHRIAGLPASRIEAQEQKSLTQKIKRLDAHKAELTARARGPITADTTLGALESFDAALPAPETKEAEGLPPLDLDLTDIDY